ncbi:gas vesicle protein (plasmid) [Tundrisphaera lichenicola]|uniref:gas vesicle protein n=1 Tax=Tundrisphaera lichenicola TaxID=2029860 RepID=UPI003EBC12B7
MEARDEINLEEGRRISLCETLDRVLNKGVVVAGEVVISVAGVDLIYLNLRLLLTNAETVERSRREAALLSIGGGPRS